MAVVKGLAVAVVLIAGLAALFVTVTIYRSPQSAENDIADLFYEIGAPETGERLRVAFSRNDYQRLSRLDGLFAWVSGHEEGDAARRKLDTLEARINETKARIRQDIDALLADYESGALADDWRRFEASAVEEGYGVFPYNIVSFGLQLYKDGEYSLAVKFLEREVWFFDVGPYYASEIANSFIRLGRAGEAKPWCDGMEKAAEYIDRGGFIDRPYSGSLSLNALTSDEHEVVHRSLILVLQAEAKICQGAVESQAKGPSATKFFRQAEDLLTEADALILPVLRENTQMPPAQAIESWRQNTAPAHCAAKAYSGADDAVETCHYFLKAFPNNANAKAMLALAYLNQNQPDHALELLEDAVEMDPKAALYRRWLEEARDAA